MDFHTNKFSYASEPFAHGLPCGKQVRWSSLGGRLNHLARPDRAPFFPIVSRNRSCVKNSRCGSKERQEKLHLPPTSNHYSTVEYEAARQEQTRPSPTSWGYKMDRYGAVHPTFPAGTPCHVATMHALRNQNDARATRIPDGSDRHKASKQFASLARASADKNLHR
jgi:hypothetical protein